MQLRRKGLSLLSGPKDEDLGFSFCGVLESTQEFSGPFIDVQSMPIPPPQLSLHPPTRLPSSGTVDTLIHTELASVVLPPGIHCSVTPLDFLLYYLNCIAIVIMASQVKICMCVWSISFGTASKLEKR